MLLIPTIFLAAVLVFLIKAPFSAFAIWSTDEEFKRGVRGVLLGISSLLLAACLFAYLRSL